MRDLDVRVIDRALEWARDGHTLWLCTVLSTYGSSPRAPGSMFVARRDGHHAGSLSGGCVEEAFLEQLAERTFERPVSIVRYGERQEESLRLELPCGGVLEVLIECLPATDDLIAHLERVRATLLGQRKLLRCVELGSGCYRILPDEVGKGERIEHERDVVRIRIGPALRLIVAGISPVAIYCAQFARALGYEVIVCDPRDEERAGFDVEGVELQAALPSSFIAAGACHAATAVVALAHDPRIDDLAMIEAVRTQAFYIGVMGSRRTSDRRAERLRRAGGLDDEDIARIHMPVGLDLGSKTPAEIALAVVADVTRVANGRV